MGEEEQTYTAIDREDVGKRLLAIGRQTLELEAIEAEMQARLDAVKAQYQHRLEVRRNTIRMAAEELQDLCEQNRDGLLARGKKSFKTLFGRIKWRLKPARIGHLKGMSWDRVTEALVRRHHRDLVREKREPAKDAIKDAVREGRIDDAELRACGLTVRRDQEIWAYDLDREQIAEHIDD